MYESCNTVQYLKEFSPADSTALPCLEQTVLLNWSRAEGPEASALHYVVGHCTSLCWDLTGLMHCYTADCTTSKSELSAYDLD